MMTLADFSKARLAYLAGALTLAGLIAFLAIWRSPPPPPPPLLMRHLGVADLELLADGEPPSLLEPLDLAVYGHVGIYEDELALLVTSGNPCYRYFNVLTFPLPEWVGVGDPWFDWLDRTVAGEWGAYIHDAQGREARFPWFGKPRLIDWPAISGARIDSFAVRQLAAMGACAHLFLDQVWLEPADWMFDPATGVGIEVLTADQARAWTANVKTYLGRVRNLIAERSEGHALANGDRSAPGPIFLENSQERWRESLALWDVDRRNVLSVDPGSYEDSLLAVWLKRGGTVSVIGSRFETQAFYLRADAARRAAPVVP